VLEPQDDGNREGAAAKDEEVPEPGEGRERDFPEEIPAPARGVGDAVGADASSGTNTRQKQWVLT
jgi:hypothetical protein